MSPENRWGDLLLIILVTKSTKVVPYIEYLKAIFKKFSSFIVIV